MVHQPILSWSTPGGTGTSKTVNPTTNTTYVITVTDSKGCTDTDDVMVSVGGSASASITGPNSVCLGSSITLTASGAGTGGSYAWSNGATTSSITISPTTTTSYTVTVSNSSGCTGTASKSVSVVPAATVNVGPDKTMCQGDELVVNASVTDCSLGTQGTSDCNHTLAAQSGWLETPSASTVCGDNAANQIVDTIRSGHIFHNFRPWFSFTGRNSYLCEHEVGALQWLQQFKFRCQNPGLTEFPEPVL